MKSETPIVHDFEERLEYSQRAGDDPFWEAVYRKAFPNMVGLISCADKKDANQYLGIDRIVQLSSGDTLRIDEKKRSGVWNDVLLEYLSNDATGAPGWMEKDLGIDYIAYAFMPNRRCLLLPWPLLRRVWAKFEEEWKTNYQPHVSAQNNGYKTWSVPVPIDVLMRAVARAMLVILDPETISEGP